MDDDQSRQEYGQSPAEPEGSMPPAPVVTSEAPQAPEASAESLAMPVPVTTEPEEPELAAEAAPAATLKSIHQESATAAVIRGIWVMVWVLAAVLFVRFLLHLLGADPNNRVVDMLYTYTHPLVAPFFAMFHYNQELIERRFEFENLLAILLYGLIAWGLVGIIKLLTRRKRNKVVTPPPAAGAPHD